MATLAIALGSGLLFILAYHTYGRWLGSRIFQLDPNAATPACRLEDGDDYVPTPKSVVFGHHFTSIAGTGPIVGPAIAVIWGWLPALLWVIFGSILIGAVHDLGSLVVSLRHNGQTVGEVAGRVLNRRVRLLFLFVLFLALTIVLAIFGLVIAAVLKQYPAAIFPVIVQIPLAVVIGVWLHRKGVTLVLPSLIALLLMYITVVLGDWGPLHAFNSYMAGLSNLTWVVLLLGYSYVASVLPVWVLLQPRDYINALQLVTALALIVVGLTVAAFIGGAPPVEGADRQPLELAAPAIRSGADLPGDVPPLMPLLFITIACGAISGFHCLVSSGTSSKQLKNETDARFVGFGGMLTEGFLAVLVILACVAGLGLGYQSEGRRFPYSGDDEYRFKYFLEGEERFIHYDERVTYDSDSDLTNRDMWWSADSWVGIPFRVGSERLGGGMAFTGDPSDYEERHEGYEFNYGVVGGDGYVVAPAAQFEDPPSVAFLGPAAFGTRYSSWSSADSLASKVGAFVDGAANFLKAMGVPAAWATALMGVLVASFAGTTLDTATRLQRYVVQELFATLIPDASLRSASACAACGYDLRGNPEGACPECGVAADVNPSAGRTRGAWAGPADLHPRLRWFTNKYVATGIAVGVAGVLAAWPVGTSWADWSWDAAGKGGLLLWPMFGATNQLLGGLAFLVIGFYLWRRKLPVWFLILPLLFMLIVPAWAMLVSFPGWWEEGAWLLLGIGGATLVLEVWMVGEAVLLWPRVKGVVEALPGGIPDASAAEPASASALGVGGDGRGGC